jgi:hypothetical protein
LQSWTAAHTQPPVAGHTQLSAAQPAPPLQVGAKQLLNPHRTEQFIQLLNPHRTEQVINSSLLAAPAAGWDMPQLTREQNSTYQAMHGPGPRTKQWTRPMDQAHRPSNAWTRPNTLANTLGQHTGLIIRWQACCTSCWILPSHRSIAAADDAAAAAGHVLWRPDLVRLVRLPSGKPTFRPGRSA